MKSHYLIALCFVVLFASSAKIATAAFDPVSFVSTGMAVDSADRFITDQINKARDAADFVMEKALMDARAALQAWREANVGILDKAFSELSVSQKEFFSNLAVVMNRADRTINGAMNDAREISELAYQLSSETLIGKNVHLLIRTSPTKLVSVAGQDTRFKCRTVGLDDWDVSINIGGAELKPDTRQLQESVFTIPNAVLAGRIGSVPIKFKAIKSHWYTRNEVYETNSSITILPKVIGNFAIDVGYRTKVRRVDRKSVNDHDFTGRNQTVQFAIGVQNGGNWQIDAASISWDKHGGEASDDVTLISPPSHTGICSGFVVGMHCGERRRISGFPPSIDTGPGWGKASISWTEFLDEDVTQLHHLSGQVSLLQDSVLDAPDKSLTMTGYITTYDGKRIAISGNQRVGPVEFELNRVNNKLIIKAAALEL